MNARVPLTKRVRWHLRFRAGHIKNRSRSWVAHTDFTDRPGQSLWVSSWQRSGSTWLAEMLATSQTTRLVYEPANVPQELFTGERAAQFPLPQSPGPELDAVLTALRGPAGSAWMDQLNHAHVVRRQVVKDVRAVGLTPLVRREMPLTPIIVLMRHPIAVARSVVELGWTDDEKERAFLHEVTSWCEIHASVLASDAIEDCFLATYEELRRDTPSVLRQIVGYAATYDHTWLTATSGVDTQRPSATDFRGARESGFTNVPDAWVDAAVAILEQSGLHTLYGHSPHSLEDPRETARRLRSL